MAARAIWKGRIRFGDVDVPVKLYAAVESGHGIGFRLLDADRKEPVRQQMVDPDTGKVVESREVGRAFEAEKGRLVRLEPDELSELEPEPSRDIEVTRFLPPEEITHPWYDRPYYVGPDDDAEGYFALVEAMRRQGREGLARWTMRKKEYVGALRVEGEYLMLITLRHAGEVVPASALEPPAGRDLEPREVKMAKQLLEAMEGDFDVTAYRDDYRERVLELVQAKAAGKVVRFPKAPRKATEASLADVLEKSLAAAGGKGRRSA
jgi:DNA end-binding protein Ku